MRRMLLSPRHAGLSSHRGEVVGVAQWPAIIDRDTHERLKARLPSRGPRPTQVRNRLLTGLVRCGRCGEAPVREERQQRDPRVPLHP